MTRNDDISVALLNTPSFTQGFAPVAYRGGIMSIFEPPANSIMKLWAQITIISRPMKRESLKLVFPVRSSEVNKIQFSKSVEKDNQ